MNIRQRLYDTEDLTLSQYAKKSKETKGRTKKIEESPLRTEFMRDRDRIVHCESFRRLKDKTQVFLNSYTGYGLNPYQGQHHRTRLTHTMEVSQIARTISRALRLNEDLTEAIALGHDLGHTPFGHGGERALSKYLPFEHNVQSLRIVEKLEKGTGLNLTFEVRDGIANHKRETTPCTLEGFSVNMADRIAYINHDIDDSLRAGIITPEDLPKNCIEVLGDTHGIRINTMITDIVKNSEGKDCVCMTPEILKVSDELRQFMFDRVYMSSAARQDEKRIHTVIDMLFDHFLKNPEQMSGQYKVNIEKDGLHVCVADYIAAMTDQEAVTLFNELFVPRNWTLI